MTHNIVRPSHRLLTEQDARQLLADGIFKTVHAQGPTRYGLAIGCDEKTARKAREGETTLRLDLAFNTLAADPHALDKLLAHFGLRAVALDAVCDTDTKSSMQLVSLLKCVIEAESPDSDGAESITDRELESFPAGLIEEVHALTGGWLTRMARRFVRAA